MSWRTGKRVAIVGAGPGGVSAAIALLKKGFDVKLFERQPHPKALGGAVLLSVPVLAILREYGIDINNFGTHTSVSFKNNKGRTRAQLPFNPNIERLFGIKGWHYGVLRSSAFAKMLELLPEETIVPNHSFSHYNELENSVELHFKDQPPIEADILIGADGINSVVAKQAFGKPDLFHIGLRIWLAWCDPIEGLKPNSGVIAHSDKYQASYFPMLHDGKPGYEWWIVEPSKEHAEVPTNVKEHVQTILNKFDDPLPRFPDATDFDSQIFCWDVYNRPSLKHWSRNRVICLGDSVHPVSPYAAYGMGMAIEDGYFIAENLADCDLTSQPSIKQSFQSFEDLRVDYVNHQVEFARKLGNIFHQQPTVISKVRDFIFDHTKLLNTMIRKDYLEMQETMCLLMKKLHISTDPK